jgi:hypothetical protein
MTTILAHCDWSIDARKRWMCTAISNGHQWTIAPPEPVGETAGLISRLRRRADPDATLLLGFDFPIGLPVAYGTATGLPSFRNALQEFGAGRFAEWYHVAEHRSQISLQRPFYPMRPGGTLRQHLYDALGLSSSDLLRRCERATKDRGDACMLFWTLGGNQVGKAALAGWREIILPNITDIALWPFDGILADLMKPGATVAAETYPGDVYSQISIPRRPVWSKRQQSGRQSVGQYLKHWLSTRSHVDGTALIDTISNGFGADKHGEDCFDATVGLFGMIDVVDGRRSEGAPADNNIRRWEGWILGQSH